MNLGVVFFMAENRKRTAARWVELLSKNELPAITSVASKLDKFSNDDISSIPKLCKVILHNQSLSSSVLKVVNSGNRISKRQITTVSRAAIVLGIRTVKNICLTSKILDGLLENKNLSQQVCKRLGMLMANAFHAALLAKMMLPEYEDDTQEEVYLAAMLYNIGETAFWSCDSEIARELIEKTSLPANQFQKHCQETLGMSFNELSRGLAETWHLGDLLRKSLDTPESRTVEMQAISLANKLSFYITSPPNNKREFNEFNEVLNSISHIMHIDRQILRERIDETRVLAISLLNSYGASVLDEYIRKLPKEDDLTISTRNATILLSQEKAILMTVKEITRLSKKGHSINELLNYTLQQIATIFHFSRSSFWMLSKDKSHLESRVSYDDYGEVIYFHRRLDINKNLHLMDHVLQNEEATLVANYRDPKWRNYITEDIEKLIANGVIGFAPIMISNKVIGMFSVQYLGAVEKINSEDFSLFNFTIEHLNMCLTAFSMRQ